jgi:hypothetical protein
MCIVPPGWRRLGYGGQVLVSETAAALVRDALTIRQFAAERLADAGDQAAAVAAAHGAHYLRLAETAAPHLTGPGQGSWLARLDTDQANLRRATLHAASRPDGTEQVLRFGVALRRYWMARNRDEEAASLLRPVLDRPGARADPQLFATTLVTPATVDGRGDIARARQLGNGRSCSPASSTTTGCSSTPSQPSASFATWPASQSEDFPLGGKPSSAPGS